MAASKRAVPPAAVRTAAAKIEEPDAEMKKAETPATSVKTESVKEASEEIIKESEEETAKEPEKKTRGRKPGVKKEPAKTAVKRTAAKKAELKSEICIQFSGKSYTQEELIKIARDVWKYDLKQKVRSLESVELYVKPEENTVYYVMNKEFTGSFSI